MQMAEQILQIVVSIRLLKAPSMMSSAENTQLNDLEFGLHKMDKGRSLLEICDCSSEYVGLLSKMLTL